MCNLLPLRLDVLNPELFRQIDARIVRVVHERDGFACRFCGFRSRKYQQVVPVNGDDRDVDQIHTACIFCQSSFSLQLAAFARSGLLVEFPELSANELNRLAMEIYPARISKKTFEWAKECLDRIVKVGREGAKRRIGTDDPAVLARRMLALESNEQRLELGKALEPIRLFPLDRRIVRELDLEYNQFPQILAFWRSRNGPLRDAVRKGYPLMTAFRQRFVEA